MPIVKTYDSITKSAEDKRIYRGLLLSNGLKVMLVNDPQTDKSAVSLNVKVGCMSDPPELPGLAHFCEHMLFMGTEKYPQENEYSNFLSQHGGSSNAYTSLNNTNYFFYIDPQFIVPGLDRFAQFFLKPLFTEGATEREINAVNSEHEKNLKNDDWRINQLERAISDPTHDYSKFGTGNKETLDTIPKAKGINIRDELLKFHSKWYSASIMSMAIISNEKMDDLTKIVEPIFSQVENKRVEAPTWPTHPLGPKQLRKKVLIVPIMDIRNLQVTFPIPDMHEHYRSNPAMYLGHLIGHEGPGSLLTELKALGWVNFLSGGYEEGSDGFSFFDIDTDLTDDGIEHTDDIVMLMFQYIEMLRLVGPKEQIFKEYKELSAINFRFKDKEDPMYYVAFLTKALLRYPAEETLCGDYLVYDFRPDLITDLLQKLTPDNIRLSITGKKFASVAKSKEKWYQTEYNLSDIPEKTLNSWRKCGVNDKFSLPKKNEFIPNNFKIVPREKETYKFPHMIRRTPKVRVWFKQDNEFLLPKSFLKVELENPMVFATPMHYNAVEMFFILIEDVLNEYTYDADLAGLSYSLSVTKYGLIVRIGGYNHKLDILLRKIIDTLNDGEVVEMRYEILKDLYKRSINNFKVSEPRHHCGYYANLLLAERYWSIEDQLEALEEISLPQIKEIILSIFSRMHIEALAYGNLTQAEALKLISFVEEGLLEGWKPLFSSQMTRGRQLMMPNGSNYVLRCYNQVHPNSAVLVYYQCGLQSARSNVMVELFCQVIDEPCFNVLRTQEQLGYIVFSDIRRSSGVNGVQFLVQSDQDASYVDNRIEAFLLTMEPYLENMSKAEFENHKITLASQRMERPREMYYCCAKYWNEIFSRQYHFERDKIEVNQLYNITKKELLEFYRSQIAVDGQLRKKLAVHVSPDAKADRGSTSKKTRVAINAKRIDNFITFKANMGLYPLILPFIDIELVAPSSTMMIDSKVRVK